MNTRSGGIPVAGAVRFERVGEPVGYRLRVLGERLAKGVLYVILIAIAFASLFPFLWMFSTSFKDTLTIQEYPPRLIPPEPTFLNYNELFLVSDYLIWLKNSLVVTVVVVVAGLLISSLAGYGFAKKYFFGKDFIFIVVLGTLMVPAQVTIVPLYIMLAKLNVVNTYWALIFPNLTGAFGVFLMRQYMATIPNELMDAARIDGAGELRIFWAIMLPLARPALAALGVFAFLHSWNQFLYPLIVTTESSMRTLPVGLAIFQGQYATRWGLVMAGATMMFLPALIVFMMLQRYFVQGIALTGLKG